MDAEAMAALRVALEKDEALRERFAAATTDAEVAEVARRAGIEIAAPEPGELSDAELASVAGGYTFPRTDWIYCDNPWTNEYCTLKC